MYKTVVDNTPLIKVNTSKYEASYSLNGSLMNKSCKALGIPAAGIDIACTPYAGPGGPLTLAKFKTEVRFPAHFTAEQKATILDSIAHCAVKEVVQDGPTIEFLVAEV
jgi:hypothetical protein